MGPKASYLSRPGVGVARPAKRGGPTVPISTWNRPHGRRLPLELAPASERLEMRQDLPLGQGVGYLRNVVVGKRQDFGGGARAIAPRFQNTALPPASMLEVFLGLGPAITNGGAVCWEDY